MTGSSAEVDEVAALVATARLFGSLLLHELDEPALARLSEPETKRALAALGVDVPAARGAEALDELAAEFHELILRPAQGGPLVQSLWASGTYEGAAAATVRKLAEVAALDFDAAGARGAQPDHLGSILLLWAEARGFAPEVSERIEQEHLTWALRPLEVLARAGGFYGQLGDALGRWIRVVTG